MHCLSRQLPSAKTFFFLTADVFPRFPCEPRPARDDLGDLGRGLQARAHKVHHLLPRSSAFAGDPLRQHRKAILRPSPTQVPDSALWTRLPPFTPSLHSLHSLYCSATLVPPQSSNNCRSERSKPPASDQWRLFAVCCIGWRCLCSSARYGTRCSSDHASSLFRP